MRNKKQFYNEPEVEIVLMFAKGDVVTLSTEEEQETPPSEGFDDMFKDQL